MQETSIRKNLHGLVGLLFTPRKPTEQFLQSLERFIVPTFTLTPSITSILAERSEKAYTCFKRLGENDTYTKLVYTFLCLSDRKKNILDEVKSHLKQAALGIDTAVLNPITVVALKKRLPVDVYNIVQTICSHGLIYRKLKIEYDKPISLTHHHFLQSIKSVIAEYEAAVLSCSTCFLAFYANMYVLFRKLNKFNMISDIIKERGYLQTQNQESNAMFRNMSENNRGIGMACKEIEEVLHHVYNEHTISYLLTGAFDDPFSEFFVKNHTVDYGLIPPFVSKHTAEMICYIGKYTAFLRSINQLAIPPYIVNSIKCIDLSKQSSTTHLKDVLCSINTQLKTAFFEKYRVLELLEFIHSTFLFGRVDFIEHLFGSLKESRKTGRQNICNLLENSLNRTFPDCKFTSLVDIFITQTEQADPDRSSESFSLYIKLDYPLSLLIEEEFVIKLVYVFKFFWKLKKIEHLARRVSSLKYHCFIQKFQFYVFNEVVGDFNMRLPGLDSHCFDIFKKEMNRKMDSIMKRLFINTRSKSVENFLYALEKYLVGLGKNESVGEVDVQATLRSFYEGVKDDICGTCLFDMLDFIC